MFENKWQWRAEKANEMFYKQPLPLYDIFIFWSIYRSTIEAIIMSMSILTSAMPTKTNNMGKEGMKHPAMDLFEYIHNTEFKQLPKTHYPCKSLKYK